MEGYEALSLTILTDAIKQHDAVGGRAVGILGSELCRREQDR
jgi:hypothetical protein